MTNTKEKTIDLSQMIALLLADIARTVPRLKHVANARIATLVQRPKKNSRGPFWAEIIKKTTTGLKKQALATVPFFHHGEEYEYLLIITPKLLIHTSPLERLRTIFHELWHIHPDADGRIRKAKHGKKFEASVDFCVSQFIKRAPKRSYTWLLRLPKSTRVQCDVLTSPPKGICRTKIPWSRYKEICSPDQVEELLKKYGLVTSTAESLDLRAINTIPPFLYTCKKRHRVRRWGKFRLQRICTKCHEKGTISPLTLKE